MRAEIKQNSVPAKVGGSLLTFDQIKINGQMRRRLPAILFFSGLFLCLLLVAHSADAQCSICTRTAQQLGEKPAKALNVAIIYLMLIPFGIMGLLGYRWYRNEYGKEDSDQ